MVTKYSRETLFRLRKSNIMKVTQLQDDAIVKINHLEIKKPYRGKRSGSKKKSYNSKSKISFTSYAECVKFNLDKITAKSLKPTCTKQHDNGASTINAITNKYRHSQRTNTHNSNEINTTVQYIKPNTICAITKNTNEWYRAKKSSHPNALDIAQNNISIQNRYDLLHETHDINIVYEDDEQNRTDSDIAKQSRKSKAKSKKTITDKKLHLNKLTLGFWNAQSVRKKASLVNDYTKSNKIDIYCIAESWIKKHHGKTISDLESIGTKVLLNPREGRTGGGTCCIHKKQLDITPIETQKRKTFEHMELKLNIQSTLVTILIVYRPESSKKNRYSMDEFFTEFANFMTKYYLLKHEVIIVGDFNFHVNKLHDPKAKRFLELIKLFSFKNIITEPTHKDGNTLDLVLIRENSILINHKVDEQNSDHSNIIFSLNL